MIRKLLLCGLVQLIGAPFCHCQEAADSKFESLAKYLVDVKSEDPATRNGAINALSQMAPIELLECGMFFNREYCDHAKPLLPKMVELLKHKDEQVVSMASTLIANLGTDGSDAIPALRDLANNTNPPAAFGSLPFIALLWVTPESQSVLQDLDLHLVLGLKRYDEFRSQIATDELDPQAVESLLATSVGMEAAMFAEFLRATGHTKSEVPVLVECAKNDKRIVNRLFSLVVLRCLNQDAKLSIPDMEELLEDPIQTIRMYAAWAIVMIEQDPQQFGSLAAKIGGTEDERAAFVEDVKGALEALKSERESCNKYFEAEDPGDALKFTAFTLKHGRGYRQRDTLRNLMTVGLPAAKLAPEVRELLNNPDEETRTLAARVLATFVTR